MEPRFGLVATGILACLASLSSGTAATDENLRLEPGSSLSLSALLDVYGRATRQVVEIEDAIFGLTDFEEIHGTGAIDLEGEAVHAVVQRLVQDRGFHLVVMQPEAPRTLRLVRALGTLEAEPPSVPPSDLAALARRPAELVRTTVEAPKGAKGDAEELATRIRTQLMTHEDEEAELLEDGTLLLQGYPNRLHGWVSLLRECR